jgi:hypothetical protein
MTQECCLYTKVLGDREDTLEREANRWQAYCVRFDEGAAMLELDLGLCRILSKLAREVTVGIPVQMNDGQIHRPEFSTRGRPDVDLDKSDT